MQDDYFEKNLSLLLVGGIYFCEVSHNGYYACTAI